MTETPSVRPFVALLSIAVILCAACGGGQPAQTKSGNQTLIVDHAFQYDDLDPAVGGTVPTAIIVDKSIYDTLTTVNPKDLSKPYPSLATDFSVSPDAKTTTFHLRRGVKFASGNPLTSADVVWSLTRLDKFGSIGGQGWPMAGLTASAPDPFTVVITSAQPNPAVAMTMTVMNAGILDSVLVQAHGGTDNPKDKAENFLNSASAGSGPYMIQSVDRTSQIVLKANPNYWGPKPVYSTVILRNAPSATQRFDIQDGQAQVALDISSQDASTLNTSVVNVSSAPSSDQFYLVVNASPAVLPHADDQNFRDAVRYGLDYQGLVALAGKGAVQATGFIPDGLVGALPLSAAPQHDLARAQAALAKVSGPIPVVQLEYPVDRVFDGLSMTPFVTKIQSDLKQVGITVNLVAEPQAVYDARSSAGKVQMFVYSNSADYPDATDFIGFYLVGSGSDTTYDHWLPGMDPAIDTLTTAALNAITAADRGAAYQALEQAMNDKAYFDWILQPGKTVVTAKSVHAAENPFTYVDFGLIT